MLKNWLLGQYKLADFGYEQELVPNNCFEPVRGDLQVAHETKCRAPALTNFSYLKANYRHSQKLKKSSNKI